MSSIVRVTTGLLFVLAFWLAIELSTTAKPYG
jgi:hypothetical protein